MGARTGVYSKDGHHVGHVSAVAAVAVAVERTIVDGRLVTVSTVDDVVQAIAGTGNVIWSDPYSFRHLCATSDYDVGVASTSATSTMGGLAHHHHRHRGGSMICLNATTVSVNESASVNAWEKMTENANVSDDANDVDGDVDFDDVDRVDCVVMSADARETRTVKTRTRYVTTANAMVNASAAKIGTTHVRS